MMEDLTLSTTLPGLDLAALINPLAPPTARKKLAVCPPPPDEPPEKRTYLHFESSRAGGCFSIHLRSTWDEKRVARFRQWKQSQGQCEENMHMAEEISTHLRKFFGGVMPDAVMTAPPRGKTAPDQPHAAHELAGAICAMLGLSFAETVKRNGIDDAKHRSRHENLRDKTTFSPIGIEHLRNRLVIVVDDVTTTGSTMNRMRSALAGLPTLLVAYVVWH